MTSWLADIDHRIGIQDIIASALWLAMLRDALIRYRSRLRPIGVIAICIWIGSVALFFLDRGVFRLWQSRMPRWMSHRGEISEITIGLMNAGMIFVKLVLWQGWHWRRSGP